MKARYIDKGSEQERIEDIPPECADAAQAACDKLCDLVAEADDELMMKHLDGEEQLTQDELEQPLDKAFAQERIIPVFVGSTIMMQGVEGLMEDICTYFPHPCNHGRFQMTDDVTVRIDETKPPCAFALQDHLRPVRRMPHVPEGHFLPPGAESGTGVRPYGQEGASGKIQVMMGKEPLQGSFREWR